MSFKAYAPSRGLPPDSEATIDASNCCKVAAFFVNLTYDDLKWYNDRRFNFECLRQRQAMTNFTESLNVCHGENLIGFF